MRRTNLVIGTIFGATLAVAGGLAIDGTVSRADAQAGFAVTPEQLQINQKISQASVRRSNRALNYLAPVRTAASDAADTGENGVKPLSSVAGSGQGWATGHIADGAITDAKLAQATRNRLPLWAVIEGNGTIRRSSGGVTTARIGAGDYRVNFARDLSGCAYTGTQDEVTAANIGFVGIQSDGGNTQQLIVRTTNQAGASTDRAFHVQVTC